MKHIFNKVNNLR